MQRGADVRILMLRGINLGARRRVPMGDLRELLSSAGYPDVRTYLQSGNIVLSSDAQPSQLAHECGRLISERFGFDVDVVVRTREELARVVKRNPLADVVTDPKRYQVSFLSSELDAGTIASLEQLAAGSERLAASGREIYAWHPEGVARSRLWNELAGSELGVIATARNWTTVTTLLSIAADQAIDP